jgi:hypothetical protein
MVRGRRIRGMDKKDELRDLAIKNNVGDFTTLSAAERFRVALKAIADENKIDNGIGMDSFDFWVKIAGFEWFVHIEPSNNQKDKLNKSKMPNGEGEV